MTKPKKNSPQRFDERQAATLIMGVFGRNPKQILNYKQVAAQLFIKDKKRRAVLSTTLDDLVAKKQLEEAGPGRYRLLSRAGYRTGTLDMTHHGYAYLVSEDQEDDVFIARNDLKTALDGDLVKVFVYPRRKRSTRIEGEVVEILERARETFVGTVEISRNYAFLLPDSRKMPFDIFIPHEKLNGVEHGQKAIARIVDWPEKVKNPFGEIVDILGFPGENDTEMHSILAEFDLPIRFPQEVLDYAANIPDGISKEEIARRKDFRKVPTFTIDPADAKDFDDALSLRPLKDGLWEVGVHIADVSHYVKPKTVLDEDAYDRGTSVYLVDRVVPMLPEKLSNGVCSLRPNEDKLTFSAVFTMNDKAEVLDEWFGRTVIHSDRRFAYEEAQEVIETGKGDMQEEILKLYELSKILKEERFAKGSVNFEREEVKFLLDEKGMPTGIYFKVQKEANWLIEEFMLLANKRVAAYASRGGRYENEPPAQAPVAQAAAGDAKAKQGGKARKEKGKTFVYRIHDVPDPEKMDSFTRFITKFGHSMNPSQSPSRLSSALNALLDKVQGTKEQNVIEMLALRSMAKARYSTQNIGHYGLSFKDYSHFTSPIRRYPDLMVHRLLAHYLEGGDSKNAETYEKRCQHSSEMERRAVEAERASIKYKQVEFMQDKLGLEFDGVVSGLTEWGIYVEIVENKCEGMVGIRSIGDDFYEFDEEEYMIVGRHSGRRFEIGDPVRVEVTNANLSRRQLDYKIVETFGEEEDGAEMDAEGETPLPRPVRKAGTPGSGGTPRSGGKPPTAGKSRSGGKPRSGGNAGPGKNAGSGGKSRKKTSGGGTSGNKGKARR
ncbi:MAG: ribonuclease R [Bacteroidales bacterium]